jgi:predicted transcriptional regulator
MKYTEKQQKRISDIECELQGELQKSAWSIIRESGDVRLRTIANKIGRRSDSIHTSVARLIELKLVDKGEERGVYMVSDYILTGES